MTVYFKDKILHRYSYMLDQVGVYGEPTKNYVYVDDIKVDFQNENSNEIANAYGVELTNLYKIYLDETIALNDSDELHDDEGNTYNLVGKIQQYSKFHHYQLAHLALKRS